MRIVLDSNIYCKDYRMSGTTFRTFLSELNNAGHSLYVPKIIIEEVVNRYGEEFQKMKMLINKMGYNMPIAPGSNRQIIDTQEAKNEYRRFLQDTLSRVRYTLLEYPNVSHEELAQRALRCRRPFRANDRGYRDALIWETILQLASRNHENPVAFITSNTRDFADEQISDRLHPNLTDDIESRRALGEELSEILLFTNLFNFIEIHIIPTLELLDDIRVQLENNNYQGLNLINFIEEELAQRFSGLEFNPEDVGFPSEFESPSICLIEEVDRIEDVEVRRLSENELLINFSAAVLCEFDFYIIKWELYTLPEEVRPHLWNEEFSDVYALAYKSARVLINISISFNNESRQITSAQITAINPVEQNSTLDSM